MFPAVAMKYSDVFWQDLRFYKICNRFLSYRAQSYFVQL